MADLAALTPGIWNIDPAHSTVGFVARHLMITKVRGRFTDVSGFASVSANPLDSEVRASVNLVSVDTGDDKRDAHLRSADFFDVESDSTMTFSSSGIKEEGGDYTLFGDLTIKGVTRSVDFNLEFDGVNRDPWGGTRASFSAEADINRKDWGLGWNVALESGGVLVSEKVKLVLDIQLVKA